MLARLLQDIILAPHKYFQTIPISGALIVNFRCNGMPTAFAAFCTFGAGIDFDTVALIV
jgi:hypothetical protein